MFLKKEIHTTKRSVTGENIYIIDKNNSNDLSRNILDIVIYREKIGDIKDSRCERRLQKNEI